MHFFDNPAPAARINRNAEQQRQEQQHYCLEDGHNDCLLSAMESNRSQKCSLKEDESFALAPALAVDLLNDGCDNLADAAL
jgi:hypothetical protein